MEEHREVEEKLEYEKWFDWKMAKAYCNSTWETRKNKGKKF